MILLRAKVYSDCCACRGVADAHPSVPRHRGHFRSPQLQIYIPRLDGMPASYVVDYYCDICHLFAEWVFAHHVLRPSSERGMMTMDGGVCLSPQQSHVSPLSQTRSGFAGTHHA